MRGTSNRLPALNGGPEGPPERRRRKPRARISAVAGLRPNDVILSVDGVAIRNENHLINHIAALPVGSRVRLQVCRDRRAEVVVALVGDWNQAQARLKVEK